MRAFKIFWFIRKERVQTHLLSWGKSRTSVGFVGAGCNSFLALTTRDIWSLVVRGRCEPQSKGEKSSVRRPIGSIQRVPYFCSIRVNVYVTSTLRRRGLSQKQTIVMIGCVSGTVTREKRSKNPKEMRTSYVLRPLCKLRKSGGRFRVPFALLMHMIFPPTYV